jgi:hypothetical protein
VEEHHRRLSWATVERLARLLVEVSGPIAKLIDAISRL